MNESNPCRLNSHETDVNLEDIYIETGYPSSRKLYDVNANRYKFILRSDHISIIRDITSTL